MNKTEPRTARTPQEPHPMVADFSEYRGPQDPNHNPDTDRHNVAPSAGHGYVPAACLRPDNPLAYIVPPSNMLT